MPPKSRWRRRDRAALRRHEAGIDGASEAKVLLYFAAPVASTALAFVLEQLRIPYAAGSLFIISVAFLLAAIRMLFVAPRASRRVRRAASLERGISDLDL